MTHKSISQRFQIGMYLRKGITIFRITDIEVGGLVLQVVEDETGTLHTLDLQSLLSGNEAVISALEKHHLLYELQPEVNAKSPPPRASLPQKFLQKAECMRHIVEGFGPWLASRQQANPTTSQAEHLRAYVETFDISLATYYNYRRAYNKCHGDEVQMATHMRRSSFGKKRLTRAQQHFLDMLLLKYPSLDAMEIRRLGLALLERTGNLWVDPDRCETIPDDLVKMLCNPQIPMSVIQDHEVYSTLLTPTKLPGKTAFYEYYKAFVARPDRGKAIIDIRYGEGAWDEQLRVFDSFVHLASEPLQYVFLDHYLLDVFIVDTETRNQRDRLWLTLLIDAYTRGILGMALLYETPSIESVQSALQQAIWPKSEPAQLGLQGAWHAYGVPVQLFLDNAWAHHSHSLESLARSPELLIDLVYRPIYKGRYGALVERYFGNLSHKLKTRLHDAGAITASHPQAVQNAAKTACLLFEDIYKFIVEEIITYQNTPHSELNQMTPNECWLLEAQEHGIIAPPVRTETLLRKFWRQFNGQRCITEKGICLFGMHYNGAALRHIPRYESVAHHQGGRKQQRVMCGIRYNPHDLSQIAVFRGTEYIGDVYATELRLPDGGYLAVSTAERELAKHIAYASHSQQVARDWVHYLDDIKDMVKRRQAEKRHVHRLASRSSSFATQQPVYDSDAWQTAHQQQTAQTLYQQAEDALNSFWDDPNEIPSDDNV